jgi:broad specificity phosphatase PhoE
LHRRDICGNEFSWLPGRHCGDEEAKLSGERLKTIYLLRHGDIDGRGRYIGSTDLPLSDRGRRQVLALAPSLAHTPINAVLCSPMRRCRETWESLSLPAPGKLCADLREADFGRWEGLRFAEIAAADSGLVDRWATADPSFAFPGGESLIDFRQRVTAAWEMMRGVDGDCLLVISHGGVIRHLLCLALDLPWEKHLLFEIGLASCTTLALYSAGAVLTGLNHRGV